MPLLDANELDESFSSLIRTLHRTVTSFPGPGNQLEAVNSNLHSRPRIPLQNS
jgi:hypothetical protein